MIGSQNLFSQIHRTDNNANILNIYIYIISVKLAISPYVSLLFVDIQRPLRRGCSSTVKDFGLHVRNNDGMKLSVGRSFSILCLHIEIHQCVRKHKFQLIDREESSGTNKVNVRAAQKESLQTSRNAKPFCGRECMGRYQACWPCPK